VEVQPPPPKGEKVMPSNIKGASAAKTRLSSDDAARQDAELAKKMAAKPPSNTKSPPKPTLVKTRVAMGGQPHGNYWQQLRPTT